MDKDQLSESPANRIMDAIVYFSENLIRDVGQELRASLALGMEPDSKKTFLDCLSARIVEFGIKANDNQNDCRKFFETLMNVASLTL
jgi:hypothetical protein